MCEIYQFHFGIKKIFWKQILIFYPLVFLLFCMVDFHWSVTVLFILGMIVPFLNYFESLIFYSTKLIYKRIGLSRELVYKDIELVTCTFFYSYTDIRERKKQYYGRYNFRMKNGKHFVIKLKSNNQQKLLDVKKKLASHMLVNEIEDKRRLGKIKA